MTTAQAKELLLLYRPRTRDTEDPEVAEALRMAQSDPELKKWFEQQQAFQLAMRARFREIHAPERLKLALLARQHVVRPSLEFWQRPVWIAAAALFIALLGLTLVWIRPSLPDRFTHYRESMVTAAVRMYGMDLVTTNASQLRQFIASKGAPADYTLPGGLSRLQLKGGALLRWRGNPVSMVCFDRGTGDTLFLFVMNRTALKDPPASAKLAQVDGLMTASWTQGPDTYVLAGPIEPEFEKKYLSAQ